MKLMESISVRPKDGEMPRLISIFAHGSYSFEVVGQSLVLKRPYEVGYFDGFQKILSAQGLSPKVYHSIWPVYNESDIRDAKLLVLTLPDCEFGDAYTLAVKCDACGKRSYRVDFKPRVKTFRSKYEIFSFSGGACDVVSAQVKKLMESKGISGVEFLPFDEVGQHFYLKAMRDLGDMIIREEETLNYRGKCAACGTQLWDMYFGPIRYPGNLWNGDDVVNGAILGGPVYSHVTYELFRSVEKVTARAPVVLE